MVVGVCNGLICLNHWLGNHSFNLYVLNPLTQDYITIKCKLPRKRLWHSNHNVHFAFGYCESSNEYKIIRLIHRKPCCIVSVFTIKVGIWAPENINLKGIEETWRDVEKPEVSGFDQTYYVLVNGVIHWLGCESKGVSICFDLKDERFYDMQLPDLDVNYVSHPGDVRVSLGELGGLLSLFYMFQAKEVDIWVMGEYGVVGSWTKLFKVGQNEMSVPFEFLHPIGLSKSGEIIIRKDYGQLLLYDPKQNSVTEYKLKSEFVFHKIFSYVGSLLSPSFMQ
ncbi:hypothetical protein IFM89_017448 [Coptis chinensis]|uniref:F-box associated beta-propeller type 1 domain-containing protein n=1 Tax=Coptis chinensis TaxID=261450 RepID=A0A835I1J6_9MAGN|nr:hypothetical protein IFM89_017448 [Coptis chinensis]